MKKQKLLFVFLILFMIVSSCIPVSAGSIYSNAMQREDNVAVEKNIEELVCKAKLDGAQPIGIVDFRNEEGVIYAMNIYEIDTSDITVNARKAGLNTVTMYASTEDMELVVAPKASDTNTYWDQALSASFTMTYDYQTRTGANGQEYLMTGASGRCSTTTGVQLLVNQSEVYMACSNPYQNITQWLDRYPTSSSWSYNTGFTKYVINSGTFGNHLGINWLGTLQRGSTTWRFVIKHYRFSS